MLTARTGRLGGVRHHLLGQLGLHPGCLPLQRHDPVDPVPRRGRRHHPGRAVDARLEHVFVVYRHLPAP